MRTIVGLFSRIIYWLTVIYVSAYLATLHNNCCWVVLIIGFLAFPIAFKKKQF